MQLNGGMGDQKLWLKSEGDHLPVKKIGQLGKGGLQEEKVVSHPTTTFLTMKLGSMPKMNPHRCEMKVRGPKRAVWGPENRLLGTGSDV